jgi:hypothetical protein
MDVSASTMWMGDGISQSIACGFGNKSGYGTDFLLPEIDNKHHGTLKLEYH